MPDQNEQRVEKVYRDLRSMILHISPDEMPEGFHSDDGIHGILMETGYPAGNYTLVVIADGTVSLYFSHGGGMIGMGEMEGPRRTAKQYLEQAPRFLSFFEPTSAYPLPEEGMTQFFILSAEGVLTANGLEQDMGEMKHPLSELFHLAHRVIGEIMKVQEQIEADNQTNRES